ncbi:hypothetical protein [Prevotella sp. E13-27]|uniref:hypothetical protein n=1 Tax=Prevotella sp. E13-27 TaxID=2938122 RepID=UPI00200B8BBB|nr:hypothetical protein [Prevotella sp. E13-27]MCK8623388.1 hypothetical protein [Prevotella sp. E13-27]
MGFWEEVKKEWTWSSIKKQWSDFLAIFIAAAIAEVFREDGFWLYWLVWLILFFLSRFILLLIKKSIS